VKRSLRDEVFKIQSPSIKSKGLARLAADV